ncbi:tetratricopeptide repeat protein [Streptomyces sp. HMX87]|uniref:tetratricopeptide repeat protein n=1 Tax=Streptomyces sp. HMX87 TaxID=3390849 RepID=UPI003A86A12B
MARFSRGEKREGAVPAYPTAPEAGPVEVRVPAAGQGVGGATVGGVPVAGADGEDVQDAVLRHLHRIALTAGRPVLATVHDERLGYVVPLRVDPDGSSHLAGEPAPATAPQNAGPRPTEPRTTEPRPTGPPRPTEAQNAEPRPSAPRSTEPRPAEPQHTAPLPAAPPPAAPRPVPSTRRDKGAPAREPAPVSTQAPTPARGFDAIAEAVLGDGPLTAPGDHTVPALLAEPTARINEAVKAGRTQEAARLAEQTVEQASRTLGPEHGEVLRLRELTAYIAYLSGDPVRAHDVSLELARLYRRAGDAEAAYGNVQSAATAWRAVRDPNRGLELGRDLIGLWTELTAEEGPAAADVEQLESARARIGRLTERARALAQDTP